MKTLRSQALRLSAAQTTARYRLLATALLLGAAWLALRSLH